MRAMTLLAALVLAAGPAAAEPTFVDVPGAQAVAVPGAALTAQLVAVTDFRCPADVDCYWEGEMQATIALTGPDGETATITVCNACEGATRDASALGTAFHFETLLPPTDVIEALGREAVVADYAARLAVGGAE